MRHLVRNTLLLAAIALVPLAAAAADPVARFEGGIGSQPLRAGALPNDVNGTNPGGRPWVIAKLSAEATTDRIRVDGEGLLLAGGNNTGGNGGQSVRARLFCDGIAHDSVQLVALEANGDFRIDSAFANNPPAICNNPILLIVSGGGNWFAAGIPKR